MIKAGPGYDQRNEFEHRDNVQRDLEQKYDKRSNLTVPIGKKLSFTSAQGQVIEFGYNADGQFTIKQDASTPVGMASISYVSTVESTLETSIATLTVDVTAANAAAVAAASSAASAATSATAAGTSATASQTSATTASTQASNAATSASQSSTSATNAAGSAATATTQATNAANSATNAGNSATAASNSASTASTQATNAGNSATASQNSATSAATEASNAATSAGAASTSASNASTSASQASTSASNAAGSASSASTQATNAAGSATAAGNSATAASTSASNASTSATNAGNSASSASTSATNAASSQSAAAGSASAASTSASTASTQASNAATSASAASTSATTATTQASNASTSAGQASTSAGNAAASASTATTQASNAAASASTATTQASAASASASAASSSATLSAQFSGRNAGSLVVNPSFNDYASGGTIPGGWSNSNNGHGSRVTGSIGGYAHRLAGGASAYAVVVQNSRPASPGPHYVEFSSALNSGDYTAAGVSIIAYDASATQLQRFDFPAASLADTNGDVSSSKGGLRHYRPPLITLPATTVTILVGFGSHVDLAGAPSIAVANNIDWHAVDIRPATNADAQAAVANAGVTSNSSAISTETSARAAADTTLRATIYGKNDTVVPDGDMRDADWWNLASGCTFADADGGWRTRRQLVFANGTYDQYSEFFPVEPGATYRIRCRIWNNGGSWSGWFHPLIHMPILAWYSLKHGFGVDPGTHDASNGIVAAADTGEIEWIYTNPTGISGNANREWQFRFYGSFTGGPVVLTVEIIRLDQYAAVTTNAAAIATVDGKLSASYGLTVDANGRIASMKLLSNGATSSVKFTADTFQVFNGSTDVAPFEVTGGNVKIKSANVGTLNVGSGGLTIQSGSSGARIVISNSVVEVYDATRLRVRMGLW